MSTSTPIRVLHVDDEPEFGDMVAEFLEREDAQLDVTSVTSAAAGIERLDGAQFDCVVSDYDMPDQNGLQFFESVRDSHPDLPFILFTGKGSEDVASDAISAGVDDYLQKQGGTGQYTLLAHRITNAVAQYRSKQEIEASQERLSLFFEQSPLGALEWTESFDVARMNEKAEEILGFTEEELVGSSWRRLIPESEQDGVAELFAEMLTESKAYDIEQETLTSDGERIRCEWHHRVVRDELGDVITIFSKFQNVSQRVQREKELAEERAFTEQALDTLEDVFYVVETDGTLTRWNERLGAVTGHSDVTLDGKDIRTLFAEDDHDRISGAIEEAIETGTATVEARLLTAASEEVSYELTGKRLTDPHGEFVGIVGIGRDLSERKERKAEIQFARDLLDQTERIADVGGWEIETATDEVFWTENLFDMLGVDYGQAPPLGEALDVYLEEDRQRVANAIETAVAAAESFDVEARFERHDGELRWFRIQGKPVLQDGEVVRLRGAVQDITDHKQREKQLEQFASIVSHDLRNPLNVAEGRLELAREECDSEHLPSVAQAHERMRDLIADLLELARGDERVSAMELVDLGELAGQCWNAVETGDATLVNEAETHFHADQSQLRQLLENLIRNAVEHGGDDVTITIGDQPDGFYVADDGQGIPPEDREQVFEPGYSTSTEGTGFGLSIIRQITEAHGWTVSLDTSTDGGIRFDVTGVA
ncbi:hybrid sensor histidine kinase/response regulator [Halosegnis rubeus]|uniref:histidine kinase n=1 Tax=Halosegnis rubeus TaxID=2212850 RepID=A0A5N5U6Z4_9EURY|nr:PAS domain S-box protein [Halosegnis rubeus]KAB7514345.1 PAS domain S-box protein [Halosegnis rubeus]KAB7518743.1 PAS domain S-box protein [Halosegnis rubeus]